MTVRYGLALRQDAGTRPRQHAGTQHLCSVRVAAHLLCYILAAAPFAPVHARPVDVRAYGLPHPSAADSAKLSADAESRYRAALAAHPTLQRGAVVFAIEQPRPPADRTADFYLLLSLFLLLGGIRAGYPRYYAGLWQALREGKPDGHGRREAAPTVWPAPLMNLFFAASAGGYLYSLVRLYGGKASGALPPSVTLALLVAGVGGVYAVKWGVARLSGWALGIPAVMEGYLYSVFLINRAMGVVLLPFIVLLAFADGMWVGPLVVVSAAAVCSLFLLRYLRAWPSLRNFFQHSRFHFFVYFCASEILPLAILTKSATRLLVQ